MMGVLGSVLSFCGSVLSFLGSWLMMILSGDMERLRAAVMVIGIVWLLFKFIASVPQIYRTLFEGSSAGGGSDVAAQPPLLIVGILMLAPMPLLVGSCRAALGAVTRANRSQAKLAESRDKWEAEKESIIEEAKLKAKAGAVQTKKGKKGRVKY